MRSRWHDPALGTWLTRDPAGYADGMCLYRYVRGNPLVYFDPFGLGALSNWEFIKMAVGLGPDGGAAAVWSGAKEGAAGGLSHTVNSATFGATDAVGVTNSTAHQGQEYAVSDAAGKVASAGDEEGVNVSERVMKALMNHTPDATNMNHRYNRPSIDAMRSATEKVSAFLLRKAGTVPAATNPAGRIVRGADAQGERRQASA